ncbi:Related to triacylglycerol lipase V [Echinococcus multilocularis]|uniref:Related to triacylglycerol lipase V n=1 Tax=Echinococcus multilocularis TaxID=6211 RepID=A0A0S4MIR8_ECHMU|nr:Related to triacylglycerol lipase V [Echinococcus multilocularis]
MLGGVVVKMKDLSIGRFIADRINSKKVVLFTKYYCPYCKKVKKIFRKHLGRDSYKEYCDVIDVTATLYEEEIMNELKKMTGSTCFHKWKMYWWM